MTPRCWLTWSAPTATTIGWSPATASWPRPSGYWPGPISRPSGAANASSTASGQPCGPSTRRRWRPSGPTWPPVMRWRCCSSRPPPSWAASCRGPRSPRRCAAAAANATSKPERPTSRPRCVLPSWPRPSRSATPTGSWPTPAVGLLASLNQQIATLEEALGEGFNTHPDAKTIRSLPGLGMVLGARVLGEFGDDQTRFPTAKSRKNYAGSAPITKASGRSAGRAGPPCPQPPPGRRAGAVGVLLAHPITRRPPLLRVAPL